MILTNFVFRST